MKIKYKDLILMVKCVAKKEHNCVLFNNKKTLVFVFTLLLKTNKKVFDVYYRWGVFFQGPLTNEGTNKLFLLTADCFGKRVSMCANQEPNKYSYQVLRAILPLRLCLFHVCILVCLFAFIYIFEGLFLFSFIFMLTVKVVTVCVVSFVSSSVSFWTFIYAWYIGSM